MITITIDEEAKPDIRVLILGVGNLLLKDEGIGVHVARRLADAGLPEDVRVVDCGTRLLDALSFIKNADRLIVVDAVRTSRHGTFADTGKYITQDRGFSVGRGFPPGRLESG